MNPLAYAKLGIAVFPCHYPVFNVVAACSCGNPDCGDSAGKHPYGRHCPHGVKNASKEPRIIRRWANGPYNVAVATGAVSGIIVVDIDPRHGGDESLARLEAEHGPLPLTWRAFTGGGGEHIYLRHPGGFAPCSDRKIAPGIDVKGDGGSAIAPPSMHVSGRRYAWSVDHHPDHVKLAEMPQWLLALVATPAKQKGIAALPESWRRLVADGVDEGGRNIAVTRLSGHLLRHDVDALVVLDLIKCWNLLRCRPPLSDTEIERTVDSICGLELARRGRGNVAR